jgi:hypothetical protein
MNNRLFIIVILAACSAAPDGWSEEKQKIFKLECESVEDLTDRIDACSSNSFAVESASQCYEKLMAAWKDAPNDLNRIMSVSKKRETSRQKAELAFSKTDYEKTMAKLENLISVTEANTALIAKYPFAMIEDSDIPVDCYTDRFQAVQEIVWKLDDRISEAEDTLAAASSLHGIVGVRDQNIDASTTNAVLHGQGESAPLKRVPAGTSSQPASDITGIKEEKVKQSKQQEILNTFPLRDQLTGP